MQDQMVAAFDGAKKAGPLKPDKPVYGPSF
jgi:hypothetical protein